MVMAAGTLAVEIGGRSSCATLCVEFPQPARHRCHLPNHASCRPVKSLKRPQLPPWRHFLCLGPTLCGILY